MPYKYDTHRQAQVKAVNAKKKTANQDHMWEYLTSHPCADCGESDPLVLEFDHRQPLLSRHAGRVMSLVTTGLAWTTILTEIAKCDLVCANCHARRTAAEHKSWRWQRMTAKGALDAARAPATV